jgi:hypothetical protein
MRILSDTGDLLASRELQAITRKNRHFKALIIFCQGISTRKYAA